LQPRVALRAVLDIDIYDHEAGRAACRNAYHGRGIGREHATDLGRIG
jgi:hypothetical protein